jgi:hypothetical protein
VRDLLDRLEGEGDVAQLGFTADEEYEHVILAFRIRRPQPERLELAKVAGSRRTVLVTIPIPPDVRLDESIEDADGEPLGSNLQTYGCGWDDGMSP